MLIEHPHDKLMKETLSFISEAKRLFKHVLPKEISNRLAFDTLQKEEITFLNEQAREFYADLLFSCLWDTGDPAQIYLLSEHKSAPERRPHFQLGGYLSEAYIAQIKQLREEKKKKEQLALIIPILIYHGTEDWKLQEYASYFKLPDLTLSKYLPGFDIIFINLADFTDEEIIAMGATFLTTTLLLFKHKDDKEYVLNNASKLFIFVHSNYTPEETSRFFRFVILYLFKAFQFKKSEVEKVVNEVPKNVQPMFVSTYDMLIEEGMVKGEAIGIQKGEAIGIRQTSLVTLMRTISMLPRLSDDEMAKLSGMAVPFVNAFRKPFEKGNLRTSQKIAVGFFSDIPGFGDKEAEKVKALVKTGIKNLQSKA